VALRKREKQKRERDNFFRKRKKKVEKVSLTPVRREARFSVGREKKGEGETVEDLGTKSRETNKHRRDASIRKAKKTQNPSTGDFVAKGGELQKGKSGEKCGR